MEEFIETREVEIERLLKVGNFVKASRREIPEGIRIFG